MISVCLPTRGRPDNMSDLVNSINATCTNPVEVVFYIDDDDLPSIERASELDCRAVIGPRIVMTDMYNKAADVAQGDILMCCCDAVIFHTPGWDELVESEFGKVSDNILLVFGKDGIHNGGSATLPFVHRKWVDTLGRLTPPYFSCDWSDTWLYQIAQMIDRVVYLPDLYTQHRHPCAGTAPMDQTHIERQARGSADNVDGLYASLLHERIADADKLRSVMR